MSLCAYDSDSQLILIETLQQENAKFAESQAIEEVTRTVSKLSWLPCRLTCQIVPCCERLKVKVLGTCSTALFV